MYSREQTALILSLIDSLSVDESRTSETHIQNYIYFTQEMLEVPMDFEFVLYKNSPYSFDLSEKLTSLRADRLLAIELNNSYPCFVITDLGKKYIGRFPKTLAPHKKQIGFIVKNLGAKDIRELGQLATALLIDRTEKNRIEDLNKLKEAISNKPDERVGKSLEFIRNTWLGLKNRSVSLT